MINDNSYILFVCPCKTKIEEPMEIQDYQRTKLNLLEEIIVMQTIQELHILNNDTANLLKEILTNKMNEYPEYQMLI